MPHLPLSCYVTFPFYIVHLINAKLLDRVQIMKLLLFNFRQYFFTQFIAALDSMYISFPRIFLKLSDF
jgi:hypothetical protein